MGAGFAQVGMLLLLTVVGLPLFFFGLMAALDRFERSLSAQPRAVAPRSAPPAAATQPAGEPVLEMDADVVTLPKTSTSAAKPAAAV
jgi:hypothetical protein